MKKNTSTKPRAGRILRLHIKRYAIGAALVLAYQHHGQIAATLATPAAKAEPIRVSAVSKAPALETRVKRLEHRVTRVERQATALDKRLEQRLLEREAARLELAGER
jgi:hypothetical protein